jgi:1,4-dihydroxy-2-naphthoate octaprenyltransferase
VPGRDQQYASTQPINPLGVESLATLQAREAHRRLQLRKLLMRSPRTVVDVLARLTRFSAALALTIPVLGGAAVALWEGNQIHGLALALNLVATFTLLLGIHALAEYRDYRRAVAAHATNEVEPLATGYGLLVRGLVEPDIALNFGHILLLTSALCGLWLPIISGWPPLFFAGLSVLLIYFYVNPPLALAGRGWGVGETALFVSLGLLQTLNSYYVQNQNISWLALLICVPFGLLCVLIQHNYNVLFERRDWLIRKRTLAVELGPLRALDVSAFLAVAVHIAIVAIVSLAALPYGALVTLAALPIALGAFARIDRERLATEDLFQVYKAGVAATFWVGILFCAALTIAALW